MAWWHLPQLINERRQRRKKPRTILNTVDTIGELDIIHIKKGLPAGRNILIILKNHITSFKLLVKYALLQDKYLKCKSKIIHHIERMRHRNIILQYAHTMWAVYLLLQIQISYKLQLCAERYHKSGSHSSITCNAERIYYFFKFHLRAQVFTYCFHKTQEWLQKSYQQIIHTQTSGNGKEKNPYVERKTYLANNYMSHFCINRMYIVVNFKKCIYSKEIDFHLRCICICNSRTASWDCRGHD